MVPGVQKTDFYDFSGNFYKKNPEYGNLEWDDDSGNLEWDDGNPGASSEPAGREVNRLAGQPAGQLIGQPVDQAAI